jgi:transcriptional regulator with XRE-family HTH domain
MTESKGESSRADGRLRQLGEYIRLQRQMADLSLRRMSEMTDVSNAYLSQLERGLHQPSIRVLRSIADALNVSADTLLVQAGLLDSAGREQSGEQDEAPVDTEAAIRRDPALRPEDREALVRIYQGLRRAADSGTSGGGLT